MEAHAFADIFPLMDQVELQTLADDIKSNGQREPIRTYEGKILDGRNRLAACLLAGREPQYAEFVGTPLDALHFVRSENITRRHLTPSQAAACVHEFETIERKTIDAEKAAAKNREKSGKGADGSGGRGNKKTLSNDLDRVCRRDHSGDVDAKLAAAHGTNRQYVADIRKIAAAKPEVVADIKAGKKTIPQAKKEIAREAAVAKLEAAETKHAKAIEGVYDVIVIDPPWPMEKIERDCRPNQAKPLDYPTMSLNEIGELKLPCAFDCHVWLWTTQRFLREAYLILDTWGMRYVCCFVWHKPGGFQPLGLPQFNCEFVLYAKIGLPVFVDTKAFPVCFEAARGKHSEKPEEFYDLVRRVTAGRRLDMFNRRQIEGFDGWGKEAG